MPRPGSAVPTRGWPRTLNHAAIRQPVHRSGRAAHLRSISRMRTTQEIVDAIDGRLRELNEEIETLDAARSALDAREIRPAGKSSVGAPDRRRSTPRASSVRPAPPQSGREASAETPGDSAPRRPARTQRTSRPRPSRALKPIPAERLESLLSEYGGLTTSALAEQTSVSRGQVLSLLRKLEAAGRIRRTGQRRGTRWHAFSDEDRIRERAAELESRRRRAA
jgi:FaeA-like protein